MSVKYRFTMPYGPGGPAYVDRVESSGEVSHPACHLMARVAELEKEIEGLRGELANTRSLSNQHKEEESRLLRDNELLNTQLAALTVENAFVKDRMKIITHEISVLNVPALREELKNKDEEIASLRAELEKRPPEGAVGACIKEMNSIARLADESSYEVDRVLQSLVRVQANARFQLKRLNGLLAGLSSSSDGQS